MLSKQHSFLQFFPFWYVHRALRRRNYSSFFFPQTHTTNQNVLSETPQTSKGNTELNNNNNNNSNTQAMQGAEVTFLIKRTSSILYKTDDHSEFNLFSEFIQKLKLAC